MWIKVIIVFVLFAIVFSLFSALRSLVRNQQDDKQKVVRFLAYRVSFSVLLLLLLGLSLYMGWIQPHGVGG